MVKNRGTALSKLSEVVSVSGLQMSAHDKQPHVEGDPLYRCSRLMPAYILRVAQGILI